MTFYGNESLELMIGLNKIGYTKNFEVDFSSRTSGGLYDHGYVRTIPTVTALAIAYKIGSSLAGSLGAGLAAVVGAAL